MSRETVTPAFGRRRRLSNVVAAATVIVGMLVAAAPVSATMLVGGNGRYHDDYAFLDCGGQVLVEGSVDGVSHLRVGKGSRDSAFFLHDNYALRETWVNLKTDDFVVVTANGLFQETKAVPLGGTIFTFTSVNSGQPFTVRDSDGNVLVRDRGSIRETIVFDTTGDDVPGGIFIESIDFQVNGPHPGLDFDLCGYLT